MTSLQSWAIVSGIWLGYLIVLVGVWKTLSKQTVKNLNLERNEMSSVGQETYDSSGTGFYTGVGINTITPAQYEYYKERPNSTYLEIKEVTNGYIITANSAKSSKTLTRVCNSSEDLMEEIAKILVELKLT